MGASRPCASEEVHVVVLGVDTCLLLGSVADAEVHSLMAALDDRHAGSHLRFLALGVERFDVHELKELHRIETTLAVLHHAATVELAWLERQLPSNDGFCDGPGPCYFHGAEVRQRARHARKHQRHLLPSSSR